jgi:hypothetical protein
MTITSRAAVILLQIAGNSGLVRHDQSLSGRVALEIATDGHTYYERQAIRLQVSFRNGSDHEVRGHCQPNPSLGFAEIYYRGPSGEFHRFGYPTSPGTRVGNLIRYVPDEQVATPRTLKPRGSAVSEIVLSFDAASQRYVLDKPGNYELKVVYRDVPHPNGRLDSNVLRIEVLPLPDRDRGALAEYDESLAHLAQFDAGRFNPVERDWATLRRAASFVDRYPDNPLTEQLREGLLRALEAQITANDASQEERELRDQLRAERH